MILNQFGYIISIKTPFVKSLSLSNIFLIDIKFSYQNLRLNIPKLILESSTWRLRSKRVKIPLTGRNADICSSIMNKLFDNVPVWTSVKLNFRISNNYKESSLWRPSAVIFSSNFSDICNRFKAFFRGSVSLGQILSNLYRLFILHKVLIIINIKVVWIQIKQIRWLWHYKLILHMQTLIKFIKRCRNKSMLFVKLKKIHNLNHLSDLLRIF